MIVYYKLKLKFESIKKSIKKPGFITSTKYLGEEITGTARQI